jgi:hypothetical protein
VPETIPFSDRSRELQALLAVIIPFVFGAIVGVVLGVSAPVYWILSLLAAIGAVLAGLEHPDARSAALRGLVMGIAYGVALLLAHAVAGTHAKVSLGSFPPFVIVIDAIVGAILSALGALLGGRRSRTQER